MRDFGIERENLVASIEDKSNNNSLFGDDRDTPKKATSTNTFNRNVDMKGKNLVAKIKEKNNNNCLLGNDIDISATNSMNIPATTARREVHAINMDAIMENSGNKNIFPMRTTGIPTSTSSRCSRRGEKSRVNSQVCQGPQ